jgi:hypothetical protein
MHSLLEEKIRHATARRVNVFSVIIPSLHDPLFTMNHFDTESDLVVKTSRHWYWMICW